MTNRERMIKTLLCEKTDRPPLPMWLGFSPWGETHERWQKESGIADLDVNKYFDFEPFFQWVPLEYGPLPHFDEKTIEETPEYVISTDWRGITVRRTRDSHSIPEWLGNPVKTPADWARYKAERLQPRIAERIAGLDAFVAESAKVDAGVAVGGFPWGLFGTPRDVMGPEELLYAFYDNPDMVRDIMTTCTDIWLKMFEQVSKKVQIDHIHIWEDMSGKQGSLISMSMVEEFMMPHYDRLAAFAKQHKIPIISVDSDGLVDELVPMMMRHGLNAFLPFEVQAGNSVEAFRKLYPKLGILGGLDKNALAKGKRDMNKELKRAERMMALGGYVPGFDHAIPPNVPWTNFKYFMEQLKKMIFG